MRLGRFGASVGSLILGEGWMRRGLYEDGLAEIGF